MKDSNEHHRELMQLVDRLLAEGKYRGVIDSLESIQLERNLPRKFWFCKARALDELGDKLGAIEAYRCEIASVARVPPDLLAQVGVLLSKLGRYQEAVVCMVASCELSPSPDSFILLASAFCRLGRMEQAREAVGKALDIDPANDEAWHNLGAYLLDENAAQAEKAFRRALEIDPGRVDTYGGLGMSYLDQRRINEAIEAAQKGLKIKPLDGICRIVVGEGMEMLTDFKSAEIAFSDAFRCDGDKPSALLGLARVLGQQGKLMDAAAWYGRGLRAWPDNRKIRIAYLAFAKQYNYNDSKMMEFCEHLDQIDRDIAGRDNEAT